LLLRDAHRSARLLAIGAVASVVVGWGVAQWPYLLPTTLKVSQAAAPSATLVAVLIVFGIAAIVILPSLGLLYVLDQRSLLEPDEAQPSPQPSGGTVAPEAASRFERRERVAYRSGAAAPRTGSRSREDG